MKPIISTSYALSLLLLISQIDAYCPYCCEAGLWIVNQRLDSIIAALEKEGINVDEGRETKKIVTSNCQQIKAKFPKSTTGMYSITNADGTNKRRVFCDFRTLCGDSSGWMRVADLNMQRSNEQCPSGYKVYQSGSIRACGPSNTNLRGCTTGIKFPSNGVKYTKVCGRITGYQIGTMWGIWKRGTVINNINDAYIDGLSLTYGTPRKHLWSFINSDYDWKVDAGSCPCTTGSTQKTQSFIGDNFFCETARTKGSSGSKTFFHPEPIFDGKACLLSEAPCCRVAGIPWFSRTITATSDDIELRSCDYWPNYGQTLFAEYEIYVK